MDECFGCHEMTVDLDGPARYDVLKSGADPDLPADGPYCQTCFASTETGAAVADPEA